MRGFLTSLAFTAKTGLAKIGIGGLGIGLLLVAPFSVGAGRFIGNKLYDRAAAPMRAVKEKADQEIKAAEEKADAEIREARGKIKELMQDIRGEPQTPRQGRADADTGLVKGLEQARKGLNETRMQWEDRAVKTLAPMAARVKIGLRAIKIIDTPSGELIDGVAA